MKVTTEAATGRPLHSSLKRPEEFASQENVKMCHFVSSRFTACYRIWKWWKVKLSNGVLTIILSCSLIGFCRRMGSEAGPKSLHFPWLMPKHRKLLNSATAQRTTTVFTALLKYQYLSKLTPTNCQILFCADWHLTSTPLICHSSLLGFFSLFAPLYILCIASHSLSKNLMVIQYSLVLLILQLLCIWSCISILLSKQLLSFP